MTYKNMTAALEERLLLYADILGRLAAAVEAEDAEGVSYYSGLEDAVSRQILSAEKCRLAAEKEARSDPAADKRLKAVRDRALAAAEYTKNILKARKKEIKARLASIPKSPGGAGFLPPPSPPNMVDIQI
jgi:hypothetical protein